MFRVSDCLDKRLISFLSTNSRDDTLRVLVGLVASAGKLSDQDVFFNAIMERERLVSTGIGMGVAIPHAKLANYDDFFIAIGVLQKGVDWHSLDGAPVRLVCLIGGPDDKQTEYLQLLSSLTQIIKDEDRRRKILAAQTSDQVMDLLNTEA